MKVLVTGGAGYIGSTVCSALLDAGHTPIILDSLITGREEYTRGRIFYNGDFADRALLERIFFEHPQVQCTIHMAALIVVPDSVAQPYEYYRENVSKTIELLNILKSRGINKFVFSSSAAIYDTVPGFTVTEDSPLNPLCPYSKTKHIVEQILGDFSAAYSMKAISLRYFNVIGADPELRTGLQNRSPSHILGKLVSVAEGYLESFSITGTDWPTRDGTGIRDYIHVWDIARAHVAAVVNFDRAVAAAGAGFVPINLGCGNGITVMEFVEAFEKVIGREIKKITAPPRMGDIAGACASAERAEKLLGWKPGLSIQDGIKDALRWSEARKNILGY